MFAGENIQDRLFDARCTTMIITRTPYRVSFAGGGTDFPAYFAEQAGCVLSTTIQSYIYVGITRQMLEGITVRHSEIEHCRTVGEIKHDLVREAMKMHGSPARLDISIIGTVPAGTGLGSSSALTVGLLRGLHAYRGIRCSQLQLAKQACEIERERLYKPIGVQDQYAVAMGGVNLWKFLPSGRVEITPIQMSSDRLMHFQSYFLLFYTGSTRDSETILEPFLRRITASKHQLTGLAELAYRMFHLMQRDQYRSFGHLLDEGWMIKKSLGQNVSTVRVDEWYESARAEGAWGGKLLGAGGGGFLLIMAPPDRHSAIRRCLGHPAEIQFRIDMGGSEQM
jgi:D-glycero-alpha-D-manno-heptose-7-phosphate kinase